MGHDSGCSFRNGLAFGRWHACHLSEQGEQSKLHAFIFFFHRFPFCLLHYCPCFVDTPFRSFSDRAQSFVLERMVRDTTI